MGVDVQEPDAETEPSEWLVVDAPSAPTPLSEQQGVASEEPAAKIGLEARAVVGAPSAPPPPVEPDAATEPSEWVVVDEPSAPTPLPEQRGVASEAPAAMMGLEARAVVGVSSAPPQPQAEESSDPWAAFSRPSAAAESGGGIGDGGAKVGRQAASARG